MASATIATLQADLQTIIKRGDLLTDSVLHLKNAILKAHTMDYWLRDLYETNFQFNLAATTYTLDIKALIPRFRTMKYLDIVDPISLDSVRSLEAIPIEKYLDSYGYLRDYVYYLAGNNIQIRASGQQLVYGIGCYLYPDTTLQSPSWIADEFPMVILYEAARTMFRLSGFDEQSASAERLLQEAKDQLKISAITTVGE